MPLLSNLLALLLLAPQAATPLPDEDASSASTRQSSNSTEAEDNILVTAPPKKEDRRTELRNMVSDIIREPRSGRTVGTFFAAICPKVFGLPEEAATAIEARMRANAEALGANRRDERENCRHNVSVIFMPPEDGPPEAWLKADSDMLDHLLSFERARVVNEVGPVRAWTYNVFRTADGMPLTDAKGQSLDDIALWANPVRLGSRLHTPTTEEIVGAVVLIELESADGKLLNQLADYATMRTLANTGGIAPGTVPAAPTILTLFHEQDAPEEMTDFDRAFISKLYSTSRNQSPSRYYSSIAERALIYEQETTDSDSDE